VTERSPRGLLARLRRRPPGEVVADYWSSPRAEVVPPGTQWLDAPRVARHTNRRISGDEGTDWLDHAARFLAGMPPPRHALSLGCGEGIIERILRERDICQLIDGTDVAEGALVRARQLASEAGLEGLAYRVLDLNVDELPEGRYDVVYSHAALHHVYELEHALDQVRRTLRPGGLLILNEFVGPSRMQFPQEHLELADLLIAAIPERLRRNLRGAPALKTEAPRLPLPEMIRVDPSESVRSAEIVHQVASRFLVRHLVPFGGTLMLLVLNDIAGNFADGDPEAEAVVDLLVHLEALLIDSRVLPSYHVYLVAEKVEGGLLRQTQRLGLGT
jgi:SAM-dependent methyltransferase